MDEMKERMREFIRARMDNIHNAYIDADEDTKTVRIVYCDCTEHELTNTEHAKFNSKITEYESSGYTYTLPVYITRGR